MPFFINQIKKIRTKLPPTMVDTILLRCLAICSIANSHLEKLYPVSYLAADGLIGNTLFFLLSGFGIALSERNKPRDFFSYYWRRITRIYPTLLIVVFLFFIALGNHWQDWGWYDYVRNLVYPTQYGYISHVMVYYIIFFLLFKLRFDRIYPLALGLLFIPYFYFCFIQISEKQIANLSLGSLDPKMIWIYYLQVMLLGGWLGTLAPKRDANKIEILGLGSTLLAYFVLKFVMVKGFLSQYFFILHFLNYATIYLLFRVATSEKVLDWLRKTKLIYPIGFIGGLTLEIYLVHYVVYQSELIKSLSFPVNILLFVVITLILSFLVGILAKFFSSVLRKIDFERQGEAPGS